MEKKFRRINGESVREGGATGGSESKHRVVHVPGGVDHLHTHSLLLLAARPLYRRLLSWHGLDHRQSRAFSRTFSVFLSASFECKPSSCGF